MPRQKGIKKSIPKKHNTEKGKILLSSLLYKIKENDNYIKTIHKIVEDKKLVMLDYFVTIYSREKKIILENTKDKYFIVNSEYKNQLKSYSKKYFDAFKRDNKISISYNGDKNIITTIGQLNFLKWTIDNNIHLYIEKHYITIEKCFNKYLENKKV